MKTLLYGCAAILTSDDVAEAVLHYAAVLGQTRFTDVVDVPTVSDCGMAAVSSVVLGPGIPVVAIAAEDDALEAENPEFVADLMVRAYDALGGRSRVS